MSLFNKSALERTWGIYKEAGPYAGKVGIACPDPDKKFRAKVQIPEEALGKQIHVILEVKVNLLRSA